MDDEMFDKRWKAYTCCGQNEGSVGCKRLPIPRWDVVKDHIILKRLVEQGRAKPINYIDEETGHSCYQNLIQCSNDDVFCMILKFL